MLSLAASTIYDEMALKVMNRKSLAKLSIGLTVYISSCDKFKLTKTPLLSQAVCLEKEDYEW